jgi:hypothetical protein
MSSSSTFREDVSYAHEAACDFIALHTLCHFAGEQPDEQDKLCAYKVTLMRVSATFTAEEKQ